MSVVDDLSPALALTAPAGPRGVDLRWLVESHRDPRPLFSALIDLLGEVASPGPKSALDRGYDLYAELVLRHLGRGAPALRVHDPHAAGGSCWRTLSYDDLHARCTALATAWRAQGIGPGVTLCVVQPFGETAALALLAGLRLGACVSLLEPGGLAFLGPRLAALAPEFLVSDPFYKDLLGDLEVDGATWLDPGVQASPLGLGSHSYLPDEPCAALFSPLRRPLAEPVPVTAEAMLLGALRDGALCLALRPGDGLAAPGFDVHQHQPALLFAALVMGATFVHVGEAALLREPALACAWPLRSLGLCATVRDALIDAGTAIRPRWAHVFKNPEEPCDWVAWREFIDVLGLDAVALSNLLIEAAAGGALLSSPRRSARAALAQLMDVTAAPGRRWTLLELNGSGEATLAEVGVFATIDEALEVQPYHLILGRRRGAEYLYGGPLEPRRCGRVFPVEEVLEALADCPFLQGASVVARTSGGATLAYRFVVLGFTGYETEARANAMRPARVGEIRRVLETRLGRDHLPDHVELFPCHARLRDGGVDHGWCRDQYLSGVLGRKVRSGVFRRVEMVRGVIGW